MWRPTSTRTLLSYQHAYHAGNAADLHKHSVLAGLLAAIAASEPSRAPWTFIDTHAGRGAYDLNGPLARTTIEAASGVRHPNVGPLPQALTAAVGRVRATQGPGGYPGSPMIARTLLRPADRLLLCERHPAEFSALERTFAGVRGVAVLHGDGPQWLCSVVAPAVPSRRVFVLIDPSYERLQELTDTAQLRPPRYPLFQLGVGKHEDDLLVPLKSLKGSRHEISFPTVNAAEHSSVRPSSLRGSGLMLFNYPDFAAHQQVQVFRDAEITLERCGCKKVMHVSV